MRSFFYSLVVLSLIFNVAVTVTAQEWQTQDTEYPLPTSFDTSQYGGFRSPFPFMTRFPNNTVLISVNGEARIEISADYAEVSASAETIYSNTSGGALTDQASVIRDVSDKTATIITNVLNILKTSANVTKIKTTQIELSPIYNWTSGTQILVGYRAVNSISFRVDLSSASAVLDSIVRAGISRIDSVSYSASSEHIAAARTRAIQDAIKDAQMQAKAMTSTIPTTATPEIFRIDMIAASAPSPVPIPTAYARMEAPAAARLVSTPQPIVGGNLVIVARVAVRFMVKKNETSPTHTRFTY